MSTLKVDAIVDSSAGNTTTINGATPTVYNTVGKNVIINGAMQIWQRGTSSTSAGYTTADRMFMGNNTANSRNTDAPTGFKYSLDITGTTGGSAGYGIVSQHIEAANIKHLVGQPATLSAYVKNVGTSTANLACELYYANTEDGFGGGSTVTYISSPTSQAITTDWTRVTFPSFTLPTNAANGLRLVLFRYDPSNNQQWRITGIQLELGSNATEFEHRSIGSELALCQRYYQYWGGETAYGYFGGVATISNSVTAFLPLIHTVQMRASPSFTYVGSLSDFDLRASGNTTHTPTNLVADQVTSKVSGVTITTSGLTANTPGLLIGANSTSGQLCLSAEL